MGHGVAKTLLVDVLSYVLNYGTLAQLIGF